MQNIDQYLTETHKTAIYPFEDMECGDSIVALHYPTHKLTGESGEFAELVGKAMRDDAGYLTNERRNKMALELGDIAWYWARLCFHLGFRPSEILKMNVGKLQRRKEEGKIQGEGSAR